jgi:hypothetical protein
MRTLLLTPEHVLQSWSVHSIMYLGKEFVPILKNDKLDVMKISEDFYYT